MVTLVNRNRPRLTEIQTTYPIIRNYDGEILWIPGLMKNVNYNYNEENKKIIWQRKKN